jgi:hypothetical protein
MGQQLASAYNANKRSSHPFSSLVICGPTNQSLFETGVGRHMHVKMNADWQRWRSVVLREEGGLEGMYADLEDAPAVCKQDQLVYLSADSNEVLDQIEEGKAYIIGGMVDRNRHKVRAEAHIRSDDQSRPSFCSSSHCLTLRICAPTRQPSSESRQSSSPSDLNA